MSFKIKLSLSLSFSVTVTLCASKRWSWPEMTRVGDGWHRKVEASAGWASVRWCLLSWPATATSSSMASASKTSRCGTNIHSLPPQGLLENQADLQPGEFCMLGSFTRQIWLQIHLLCDLQDFSQAVTSSSAAAAEGCGLSLRYVSLVLAGRWFWNVSWGRIWSTRRPRPHFTTGRSKTKNAAWRSRVPPMPVPLTEVCGKPWRT